MNPFKKSAAGPRFLIFFVSLLSSCLCLFLFHKIIFFFPTGSVFPWVVLVRVPSIEVGEVILGGGISSRSVFFFFNCPL